MPHIRILRHYIHTPLLLMALAEFFILVLAAYLGSYTRLLEWPSLGYLPSAIYFAAALTICMITMGVYEARLREGFVGMMLRTAVAIFLIGSAVLAISFFLVTAISMGRGVMAISALLAFAMLAVFRWLTNAVVKEDSLKKRVVVLGAGRRARAIALKMRRAVDQRGFVLHGFLLQEGSHDLVSEHNVPVYQTRLSLLDYCLANELSEIVVAVDERRRSDSAKGVGLPIDDLMDCRLAGITVCDVQEFIEREAAKVDIELLHPSWFVFSDGFVANSVRVTTKRLFDLTASLVLLALTWPVMLLAAFAVGIPSRFKDPILYKQIRVGLNSEPFSVLKFRSMKVDAEKEGQAVWAEKDDPRITRVGAVLRKTRIDELPQLINVLRGDMSFVGPRPERPQFVDELNEELPYYKHRHKVKPGITGWAQLCYPYGASVEDAKEKLQYDLYYLKNHSIFLDVAILLQTVEVVLVGEGAR